MGSEVDYHDVQAMVDKAVDAERWSRNRHVESIEKDLRAELRREVMELREEMGEVVVALQNALETERAAREESDRAIANALDARTEHLV